MPNIGKNQKQTCLLQDCQISFQVITLGNRIPTILAQMLFNRMVSQETIYFSSICLDSQITEKRRRGESAFSNWQTQSWYSELLRLSVKNPIILPLREDLLKGPQNKQHALIQNWTFQLAAWLVSGSVWQRREYQKGLQTLLYHQEEKELSQLTYRPGISGVG